MRADRVAGGGRPWLTSKFPFSAETLKGDTREARDVLGKRFVEYAAEKGWDTAAKRIDELERWLLFLWDSPEDQANLRRFFRTFRAEWVVRQ